MTSSCVTWYCFKGALFKAVGLPNQKFDWGETLCVLVKDFNLLKLTSCMTLPCLFVFFTIFFQFWSFITCLDMLENKARCSICFLHQAFTPRNWTPRVCVKTNSLFKVISNNFFYKGFTELGYRLKSNVSRDTYNHLLLGLKQAYPHHSP